MQSSIPKRLVQTGKSSNLPMKEKAAVCNLRLLNPGYDYLFFDDQQVESFIDHHFPHYRAVFDSFRFRIQRYDFFRYLAVYYYGGFYFDLDVFLVSGLSDLLGSACVFPFEGLTLSHYLRSHHRMDWQIGNYAFGAAEKHPFLHAVIENCVKAQNDPKWVEPMMHGVPPLSRSEFFILNTTGPGLLSRTLAENPALAQTISVLFPEDVCDVRLWNRFGDLGIHLMDGSWRMKTGFLRRRIAQRWEVWTMQRLLKESRRLGKARTVVGGAKV